MKYRIWLALIAVYLTWGSTYLAIRFAVETLPPFLMAASRFIVSGAILFLWRHVAGDPLPKRVELRSTALIGLFLLVGGNGGISWAEQYVPSGVAALIVGSTPLWIVLLDALRPRGKKPTLGVLVSILVGFLGIVILVAPTDANDLFHGLNPIGSLVLVLAALSWAIGSLIGRDAPLPSSPLMATAWEMLFGAVGLLALGTLTGELSQLDLQNASEKSLWGLAYLIVFGSLVGFTCYTWLLRVAPISLASTYAYVNPLIAVILGNLLAAEPLTLRVLIAALIILGSVVFVRVKQSETPTKKEKEDEVVAFTSGK